MSSPVHGHDVIAMIRESQTAYTRETLIEAITAHFGSTTRFFTCSAEGMTAGELVDFLASRGKFMAQGDGFTVDPAQLCQH